MRRWFDWAAATADANLRGGRSSARNARVGGSRRPIVLAFVDLEGLTGRLLSIDRFPSHPEDAGQLHPHLALGCRLLCLLAHLDGFAGKPLSLLELPA
jgi:hypothetical protein